MTAEDRIDTALQQAADDARDDRGHRGIWVGGVVLLAGLLIVAVAVGIGYRMISDLGSRADSNAVAAQQLYDQVRDLGGTPIVQAPVPGERGPVGPQGPEGPPGRDGVDGRDGADGTTPLCLAEPGQCRGADGTGVAGVDGQDGRDGAPGEKGEKGEKGDPGEPGPVCPAGYELRNAVITADDGSTYQGKACVDPGSSRPPTTTTTSPPLLPLGR